MTSPASSSPPPSPERDSAVSRIVDSVIAGKNWTELHATELAKFEIAPEEIRKAADKRLSLEMAAEPRPKPSPWTLFIIATPVVCLIAFLVLYRWGIKEPMVSGYAAIGHMAAQEGKWEDAEKNYKRALDGATGTDNNSKIQKAEALSGLAEIRLHDKNYPEAEKMIQESLDIRNSVPYHFGKDYEKDPSYANLPKWTADALDIDAKIKEETGKTQEAEDLKSRAKVERAKGSQ